jgi:hypothetical protein
MSKIGNEELTKIPKLAIATEDELRKDFVHSINY